MYIYILLLKVAPTPWSKCFTSPLWACHPTSTTRQGTLMVQNGSEWCCGLASHHSMYNNVQLPMISNEHQVKLKLKSRLCDTLRTFPDSSKVLKTQHPAPQPVLTVTGEILAISSWRALGCSLTKLKKLASQANRSTPTAADAKGQNLDKTHMGMDQYLLIPFLGE